MSRIKLSENTVLVPLTRVVQTAACQVDCGTCSFLWPFINTVDISWWDQLLKRPYMFAATCCGHQLSVTVRVGLNRVEPPPSAGRLNELILRQVQLKTETLLPYHRGGSGASCDNLSRKNKKPGGR